MSIDLAPVVLRHRPVVGGPGSAWADLEVVDIDEQIIGRFMVVLAGEIIILRGYYHGVATYRQEIRFSAGINEAMLNANIAACIDEFLRGHGRRWIRHPEMM